MLVTGRDEGSRPPPECWASVQHRVAASGTVWPLSQLPKCPWGGRSWQQELGLTQDGIYSLTGEKMKDTEEIITIRSLGGGFSVVSLGAQGGFLGLTVSSTNPRTNSWFKKREREEMQPLSCLLLTLPARAPAWTVESLLQFLLLAAGPLWGWV